MGRAPEYPAHHPLDESSIARGGRTGAALLRQRSRIAPLSGETRPDRVIGAVREPWLGYSRQRRNQPKGETRKERVLAHAMFTPGRQAGCICVRLDLNSNLW